jgi:phospholipid N-methyltransferase
MNNKILSPVDLQEAVNSFRISRIILTAYELEVFSVVGEGKKTSSEISEMLHTDERATDRLLNALVVTGLIEKKGNKFSNSPLASKHLVKSSPAYMGGIAHIVNLWDSWDTLTKAVKAGTSILTRDSINERGKDWLEAFIAAMHSRGGNHAREILSLINFDKVKAVIDIGGGSGAFLFEFIKKNKQLKGVIYDLPNVVPLTKKYISKEGLNNSIATIPGDYLTDELGSEYDMAFLSAVIHSNSPSENQLLFKKCYESLNASGQIVILDYMMDESRTLPGSGAFFSINMLVGTEKGDTYTEKEVTDWLITAGFKNIEFKKTSLDTSLMIGYKN